MILVHGTWHDGRSWREVISALAAEGITSFALDLPSSDPLSSRDPGRARAPTPLPDLADDVAALWAVVEATPGEIVLCGHGYGGMVISEVGHHDRVGQLVFLAAFCPEPGERVLDLAGWTLGPAPYSRRRTVSGLTIVGPRAGAWVLYSDLARRERARRSAELVPSSAAVLRARARSSSWLTTPATYVVCRRDRALGVQRQRHMAYRVIRAQLANNWVGDHAVTLRTGHCAFYSEPAAVAELLRALLA